jgi:lysophospholipase L1-like esterase
MMIWPIAGTLALVAILGMAELGSRWWMRHRSRYHVWPAHARIEIRMDPDVFPELERRCRFYINADGERGSDVPADTRGLYRVLAVGGSAVECFGLDQASSWPGCLERLLNTPANLAELGARRVHVGNIGHSGVGSAELEIILSRVLPQYEHLDAILIMVGASDVYHWLEEGAQPSRPPFCVPEHALFAEHPLHRYGWKPSAWALAEVARRLRRAWLHPAEIKERAAAWFATARRMRAAAQEIRRDMPDATVVATHFEEHFTRVVRLARAHADSVIVVRQPWFEGEYSSEELSHFWQGGLGKAWKEQVSVYYGLEIVNRLLELVDSRAADVADALGVPQLDLRPLLTLGLRHYYDHDHHTAAGAAVIGRAVATALVAPKAAQVPKEAVAS